MDYSDVGGGFILVVLVFIALIAGMFLLDLAFSESVAQEEIVQFKGYDEGSFFIVTVSEKGETRFDVNFQMYEQLEVRQKVFVSYRVGKLEKYQRKIMEN
jgi:hypothetical protein